MAKEISPKKLSPKELRIKKKKKKKRIRILLISLELLVVIIAIIGATLFFMPNSKAFTTKLFMKCPAGQSLLKALYKDDYEKNVMDKSINKDNIDKVDLGDGYTNIALFGIDPRNGEFEDNTHTDSIIIISINNKTSDIKMCSIYRDTLVRIMNKNGKEEYKKANSAFFENGAEGAMSMINNNFDMDITEYALVNFSGLATIIDALGGIDVTLSSDETKCLNDYLVETRALTGMSSPDVKESGFVHLNGLQSTAYCRIRYASFTCEDGTVLHDDYGRTARQRYVLNKILIHAKNAGISNILDVADEVIKKNSINGDKILATNMSWSRIQDLLSVAVDCNLVGTIGFPYDSYTPERGKSYYGYVIPRGLSQNVVQLHAYLFDEPNYQPTNMVKKINDYLIKETGVKPQTNNNQAETTKKSNTSKNTSK